MNAFNRLFRSIQSAKRGLCIAFSEEQNFRIQTGIAASIVLAALVLRISSVEWAIVLLTIGAVLTAEIFNSVLERVIDAMKPRVSPVVRYMKDLSSAAVLVLALCALLIGLMLFIPRVIPFAFN
ncbi:diacylglycerol kinase [Candidatus Uhrbacteria bacterium]|nr:diacylglycerol kinase [Candidatus Uhrbacteria bacterium]